MLGRPWPVGMVPGECRIAFEARHASDRLIGENGPESNALRSLAPMHTRFLLRQATAEQHALLDRHVSERGLLTDLDGYGIWLAGTRRFSMIAHEAIARSGVLSAAAATGLAPPDLAKVLELIDRDLEDIRSAATPGAVNIRLAASDEFDGYGILYVTEGASLGARVIANRVRDLGCTVFFGARYVSALAAQRERWGLVVAALDRLDPTAEQQARMVDAARRAFDVAGRCYGISS
jgi:heme oxygenase